MNDGDLKSESGFIYITDDGWYLRLKTPTGFGSKYKLITTPDINSAGIFTGSKIHGCEISNEELFKSCLKVAATAETTRKVTLSIAGDK